MKSDELRRLLEEPADSLLRALLSAIPCAASIGLDGKIVYANDACAEMWGFSHPGHMRGRSFFELIADEWHEPVIALFAARSGFEDVPWTYELEGRRVDGSIFPYRINSVTRETDLGKATFAFFTEVDACRYDATDHLAAIDGILTERSQSGQGD